MNTLYHCIIRRSESGKKRLKSRKKDDFDNYFFRFLLFKFLSIPSKIAVLADSDRARLQKLLLTAELDLESLNFTDPIATEKFMNTSRQIRSELAHLKRANFDVSRLEQQRDAVIERLAKTDSECALARRALYGKESDLRETQIDNELNQEKITRLQIQNDNLESVKEHLVFFYYQNFCRIFAF